MEYFKEKVMHEITQGSKKLFSNFFRSILIEPISGIKVSKSAFDERTEFFRKNLALETTRLGEFTNYHIKLLAEASLLIEMYGHLRFDIKSEIWKGEVSEYGGVFHKSGVQTEVLKELSFQEAQEFKAKQQGIYKFLTEFESAVSPHRVLIDPELGELDQPQRDVSELEVDIKVGKLRLTLPKQLNQQFVTRLFEMLEEFHLFAIPPDLKLNTGKKPAIHLFYRKVLAELLPFIETVIIESDRSLSNTRFIAGLVFASFNQMIDRSDYEQPRGKYKKGRNNLTIDYYSFLAKSIRNYSIR